MKEKETDPRIASLTKLWCEKLWKEKYGLIGAWSGKEAKLLKDLLSYSNSNFGAMRAEEKCVEAMQNYLNANDTFVAEKKHPFSMLYSGRAKYFVPDKKPSLAPRIKPEPPRQLKMGTTKDEIIQQILDAVEKDKNYLTNLYKGIRLISGITPATKALKDAVNELLDPQIREAIDKQLNAEAAEIKGFQRLMNKPIKKSEEEVEPEWK